MGDAAPRDIGSGEIPADLASRGTGSSKGTGSAFACGLFGAVDGHVVSQASTFEGEGEEMKPPTKAVHN